MNFAGPGSILENKNLENNYTLHVSRKGCGYLGIDCKAMALLRYFKTASSSVLPDPSGPLSNSIPSSAIVSANKAVKPLLDSGSAKEEGCTSRGKYSVYTEDEKLKIAKRAAEMGVTNTIRHFRKEFVKRPLKESTVRTWMNKYKKELAERRKCGGEVQVKKIPMKRRGHPLLLGEVLDNQVKDYIKSLREAGAVINSAIVMAVAEGIVKNHDSNMLMCNGGYLSLTKNWAKSLLHRLGYVKRRASSKAKVTVADFEAFKSQFVFDVKTIIEMEEIPSELVINWDHTGIHYVPVSSWTMAKEGSKRIEIFGTDDKRQITAVFADTLAGDFLYPQVIYAGKTSRCLPSVQFPAGWHVTYTENHWANEKTTEDYINHILLPYIKQKRVALSLGPNHPALVLFDRFKAQCTGNIFKMLDDNNIRLAVVPANCTDRLQPLDVSVNKSAKEYLRRQFQQWYSDQVCFQLERKESVKSISLQMSVVKPLGAKWMIGLYDYFKSKPDIIINGFKEAGIYTE